MSCLYVFVVNMPLSFARVSAASLPGVPKPMALKNWQESFPDVFREQNQIVTVVCPFYEKIKAEHSMKIFW